MEIGAKSEAEEPKKRESELRANRGLQIAVSVRRASCRRRAVARNGDGTLIRQAEWGELRRHSHPPTPAVDRNRPGRKRILGAGRRGLSRDSRFDSSRTKND